MQSISDWLSSIGLDQYAPVFAENDIEFDLLVDLNDQSLQDIGVASVGHRLKLLKAIAGLKNDNSDQTLLKDPDSTSSPPSIRRSDAERRYLTVMFCDLVGSTELSQKLDPEALRELMRSYQQCCGAVIEKYDGHVAQYLGDGLMTYFGWPRAHEDDAERAIRAGLEIVEAVKQVPAPGLLQVRVGIATGPVVVGETGDGDASVPKLAVGETPNVAARIQGLAGADQVMIGADTRRLVGGTFDLDDSGEHVLKGIVEPMRAWRVTGESRAEGRFDAAHGEELTPLVGRDLELGLLMDRWARAQEGEGQVVLLSGEPGIGKSRILSALREKLEGEGAQAMRFQCSPYYINSAFWPSIDNFERALKFARDESPESKLDNLESLIVGHYQRPLADVRFIAAMLTIPCDERYGELAMTPQKFKDETLRTLVDLTEAAANKQPSVLMFEDAHWADPTTLEVLDLMIDRVKAMPLLIVLTHRPEFQNRWADHGHVISLNLSKLTRAQSAAMTSRVTGGKALPDDFLEQIIAKTDGVPLFVEELTKSILESGELKELADSYEYVGGARNVTIPATLRDSLMARLDRFMPVKEIAQIGAAIGREFSYELVSAVAPLSKTPLDDALAQLTDSGLAFRRGTPPDAIYTFKHALVQDAAYDSLLKSKRQVLHGKIARVIEERFPNTKITEPEVLAHHLTAAGLIESAIPLWQRAGELALHRMSLREAISHLDKGLELIDTLPASVERDTSELALRLALGDAWIARRSWSAFEVWNNLHPALKLAKSLGRNDALVPILRGLHSNIIGLGRVAESVSWAQAMLDMAKMTSDDRLLIAGHNALVYSYFWLGRLVEAMEHADKVLALYDEANYSTQPVSAFDPKTHTQIYRSVVAWMLGCPDRAVQCFDEGIAHARRLGHPFHLGWALSAGADVFDWRREPEVLREHAQECERLGKENAMPFFWKCMAPTRLGRALILEGKVAEGIAQSKAAGAVWEASGGKVGNPYGSSVLAEAMAMLGDIDDALQLIDESIEQVERPGWEERVHYAEILRLKGWMLTLKDDPEGAENNYLASLDWAREQKAKSWELRTSTSLAKLWQTQGKNKEALDLLKPVYEWFTEGFDTKDLKDAKALLEELGAE
jgi:class 3 adenylate cyclase/tetratricopeptide (TPR) repeat protein